MGVLSFVEAMTLGEQGFDRWAAKPHNAKWLRRIDGTPIKNDLLVNIATVIAENNSKTEDTSSAPRTSDEITAALLNLTDEVAKDYGETPALGRIRAALLKAGGGE